MRQQQYLGALVAVTTFIWTPLHFRCAVAAPLTSLPAALLPVGNDATANTPTDPFNKPSGVLQHVGSVSGRNEPTAHNAIGILEKDGSKAHVVETTKTSHGEWTVDSQTTRTSDNEPDKRVGAILLTVVHVILCSPMFHILQDTLFRKYQLRQWHLFLIYPLYLMECAGSNTRQYLSHTLSPSAWTDYITSLKLAEPTIEWRIECYHYGRKNRRVTTHRASKMFGVGHHWRDTTTDRTIEQLTEDTTTASTRLDKTNIALPSRRTNKTFLKATVNKLCVLLHPDLQLQFLKEERLFESIEGGRDTHYTLTRRIRFPEATKFWHRVLVFETGLSNVVFASGFWFWLASVLGLTLPYRAWFNGHCRRMNVTVTKENGARNSDQEHLDPKMISVL